MDTELTRGISMDWVLEVGEDFKVLLESEADPEAARASEFGICKAGLRHKAVRVSHQKICS